MKKQISIWLLMFVCNLLFGIWFLPAPSKAEEQVFTKGDAIKLLSSTDFVKKKISQLLSWTIGYDISKVNKVRLTPSINYIKALPRKVPPDGRTVFDIVASVDDPSGLSNIAGVRADLSNIQRLSNTVLVDNGLFGDERSGDGLYTLQTSVPSRVISGAKEIPIAVANKAGWLAVARTNLDVSKNPIIIEVKAVPNNVKADGISVVTVTALVDNPGRLEDLESVYLDLSVLGGSEITVMSREDQMKNADLEAGVFIAQLVVPGSVAAGDYTIRVKAKNIIGGNVDFPLILKVYK